MDKPIKNRKYYTIIEYEPKTSDFFEDDNIYLNNEWLAIVKTFNEYFPESSYSYDFSNFFKDVKIKKNLFFYFI